MPSVSTGRGVTGGVGNRQLARDDQDRLGAEMRGQRRHVAGVPDVAREVRRA
jgi:hypothetical protein